MRWPFALPSLLAAGSGGAQVDLDRGVLPLMRGPPHGTRRTLEAKSPTALAGRIQVPLSLATGGADFVAPISHSRKVERALKCAGLPAGTPFVDSEDRGSGDEGNRRRFCVPSPAFLSRCLGGDKAP